MRRPSAITIFVLSAFAWMIVLTLVWTKVSAWTSYPVGVLANIVLEQGAPMWVRTVRLEPGMMEVDTTVPVADATGRRGEITVDASPARYAYSLPIFLALLLAARGKNRMGRAVAGYLLLLPAQAFSLTFYVLMQLVLATQLDIRALRVEQWQMELIVYAYQLGSLVVPTLAPIVLWIWLDKKFLADVVMRGWKGEAAAPASRATRP